MKSATIDVVLKNYNEQMDTGEFMTRGSIRLALIGYVFSLATWRHLPLSARLVWTVSFVAYLVHAAAAFAYYHDWSHDAAYIFTAKQTARLTGINWGGGLYCNYLFTLIWFVDVLWSWREYGRSLRFSAMRFALHVYMAFIAFNATVVFATGFSRWLGITACVLLAALGYARWSRTSGSAR